MANPYISQTITGYNANPPSDDGQEIASNQGKWSTVLDKVGNPLRTLAEGINTQCAAAFAKVIGGAGVTSTATSYAVQISDQSKIIAYTGTGGDTVTTPDATTVGSPFVFAVVHAGSGALTLDGSGAQTINGDATITMVANDSYLLFTNGTNWFGVGFAADLITTLTNLGIAATQITSGTVAEARLPALAQDTAGLMPGFTAQNATDGAIYRAGTGWASLWTDPSSTDLTNGGADNLTEVEWTSISSSAREITIDITALSITGTDDVELVIGDSGGYELTGYDGINRNLASASTANAFTTEVLLLKAPTAAAVVHGLITLRHLGNNVWVIVSDLGAASGTSVNFARGSKTLSAALDRVKIQVSGTDTFDGGTAVLTVRTTP